MKFKNLFLFITVIAIASCGKYEFDTTQVNQEIALQQAKNRLGVDIDPNQNWRPIRQGSVTITANADLQNITKVQVLTESPFGNEDAMVLATKECKPGQQVTLTYEAPDYLTQLVAACVNDKGRYFIKVFDIDDQDNQTVDFKQASARNRASSFDGYPNDIILGNCIKSFNAERAEASLNSEYKNVVNYDNPKGTGGRNRWYDVWNDGSWINDRLWEHAEVHGDGGWDIENGTICRPVSSQGDINTIKAIINSNLKKTGGTNQTNGRANNWQNMVQGSEYFTINNNYVESNGTPVVLVPVQINTSDGGYNSIYYYYYKPEEAAASGMDLTSYIKTLPKFKAINGYSQSNFKRVKEYLLPYYGNNPVAGMWASAAIPEGYYIGFLNRKDYGNNGDMTNCASGCTYGDGNLNFEVNHLFGHFFSALSTECVQNIVVTDATGKSKQQKYGSTVNGMDWTSPRIAVYSGNTGTYLCFEDGSDCNFCDMIVEIKQGTKIIEENVSPNVAPACYTMCFEDRPLTADYDMNDVVLTAERLEGSNVKLTLLACGAEDLVTLHGTGSSKFEGKEIHDILGLDVADNPFLNTVVGGHYGSGESDIIDIGNKSIEDFLTGIWIYNETTRQKVEMPSKGSAPFAIIVPMGFNYPKEGADITKAYVDFLKWASDVNASKDWYRSLEGVDRFPLYFIKN